ncbi:Asp23/Gls24 family envelope stress response protein, partial [Mycobacterium kansasii]
DMVLEKIAGKTASEVDGVLSLQGNLIDNLSDRLTESDRPQSGVDIELDDQQKTVAIELDAILEYGKRAEEILTKVT